MTYDLWGIIENGPFNTMKTENEINIMKDSSELTESDKRILSLNAKAIHTLYCALSRDEFNRVQGCDCAYEIWHLLEVTHEGTNLVKESKMSMLVHEYELFSMERDEFISSMFTRFTNITNGSKVFGKIYSSEDVTPENVVASK